MEFIEANRTMPLDGVFLLDKNVVILLSPYLDFPHSKLTGIPFEHKLDGQTVTGGIHVYQTDVPLALFLAWISTFRGSFFEDQHPIGFYIQEVLNESMAETVVYEDARPTEDNAAVQNIGDFQSDLGRAPVRLSEKVTTVLSTNRRNAIGRFRQGETLGEGPDRTTVPRK